jgi:hypothetical protein
VLSSCSWPEVVYRDAAAWENFSAEGFLPDGCGVWAGWRVEMLSTVQAHRLREFITAECADHHSQRREQRTVHARGCFAIDLLLGEG